MCVCVKRKGRLPLEDLKYLPIRDDDDPCPRRRLDCCGGRGQPSPSFVPQTSAADLVGSRARSRETYLDCRGEEDKHPRQISEI